MCLFRVVSFAWKRKASESFLNSQEIGQVENAIEPKNNGG